MTVAITKQYGTANMTACSGREIKYIVIHYTAGVKSTKGCASNTATWYTNSACVCSSDFVVDDETIVQYNGDIANYYTWHCGGTKYNNSGGSYYGICTNKNSIGIEICSTNSTGKITDPNGSEWSFTDAVISMVVGLTKYLMEKYDIPAENVIRHYDVTGKNCVPTYSEVLTENGWVSIKDIEVGDKIACADIDNLNVIFDEVYDKVPIKKQDTYTCNGFTATKDHRVVYCYDKTRDYYRIDSYGNVLQKSKVHIPLACHSDFEGLPLTFNMLAFYIAVQADGHYMYERNKAGEKRYFGLEFHFKKQRKIDHLIEILDTIYLDYSVRGRSDGTTVIRIYNQNDINIVNDICEKYLENKCFSWQWLKMSKAQAKFFLEEILLWDGCVAGDLYTSCKKQNLDVVSAIAAINGVGSNVCGNNVCFRQSPYMTLSHSFDVKRNNNSGRHTEVTCVSVKTGIFLVRQNGKTFITGNCPGIIGWNAESGDESAWEDFKSRIATATTVATTTTTAKYYVQVGAFAVKSNAENFLASVKEDYPSAFIKTATSSGATLYYVQVGAFASESNAKSYLSTVSLTYPNAFIKTF